MIFLTTGILITTFYFLIFRITNSIKKELPSLIDDYQILNEKLKKAEIKKLKEREEELLKWHKIKSSIGNFDSND